MELLLPAYAKINWTLEVLGRFPAEHRYAGFTEIASVVFLLDLHDKVFVRVSSEGSGQVVISCTDSRIPQTSRGDAEQNICFRAARLFQQKFPEHSRADISINIEKHIPLAGGLGGSATDGVSVLRALIQIFEIDPKELLLLARELSSDASVFALGSPACLMEGRGEIVTSLPLPKGRIRLILLNPGFEMSAADAYKGFREDASPGVVTRNCVSCLKELGEVEELVQFLGNDLERSLATLKKYPVLTEMKQELLSVGCIGALMSGSGSTVFGVLGDGGEVEVVVNKLKKKFPGCLVTTTNVLRV